MKNRKNVVSRKIALESLEQRLVLNAKTNNQVVAAFGNFYSTFSKDVAPLAGSLYAAGTPSSVKAADAKIKALEIQDVNALATQLSKIPGGPSNAAIRGAISGSTSKTGVTIATGSNASAGSLLAVVEAMNFRTLHFTTSQTNKQLANVVTFDAIAATSGARAVPAKDVAAFNSSYAKAVDPLVKAASKAETKYNNDKTTANQAALTKANNAVDTATETVVNDFGAALAKSAGTKAVPTIRVLITGSTAKTGTAYASSQKTPSAGSLLATLESIPAAQRSTSSLLVEQVITTLAINPV